MTIRIMYSFCCFATINSRCYEDSRKYSKPVKKVNMDNPPLLEHVPYLILLFENITKFFKCQEFFLFSIVII